MAEQATRIQLTTFEFRDVADYCGALEKEWIRLSIYVDSAPCRSVYVQRHNAPPRELMMLKTLRFGVELEVVGVGRDTLASAVHSVVGGIMPRGLGDRTVVDAKGRTWTVVRDASLSGGMNSGEVVTPILGYDDIPQLQDVVRAVRRAGGRCDSSTGVHVHASHPDINVNTLVNLAKYFHKNGRLIAHALGISERRLSTYCRPIDANFIARLERRKPKTMEELNQAWYGRHNATPARYCSTRYQMLNYNAFFLSTGIEVRAFEGTLHAGEIRAYVIFCLALVAKAMTSKCASSKQREFDPATAKYDFRVVLLGLNMVGDEFKTVRYHLLKRLAGSAAWKHGRPMQAKEPAA